MAKKSVASIDPAGKTILAAACVMLGIGAFVMRTIIEGALS